MDNQIVNKQIEKDESQTLIDQKAGTFIYFEKINH